STANGTTQVNIQTPNNKGVSHNKYQQFDVSKQGVILNNSSKTSKTQIGGYIQGNELLNASGSAKIILNEVNSRNPSQLNGVVEVAGQKAQVVIANPSGITCNGCGFINASRGTLTTGKPIIENGDLTGYQVEQGHIAVTGKGLDSSGQNYTDLIARTVSINSAVWANDLNVVAGRNKVSVDAQTVTSLGEDDNPKPEVGLDVSALGGMYAGKIQLVGTEKGVGVHNAGELGASAGNLIISADGKISNTGTLQAKGDIQLSSQHTISNSQQIYSKKNLQLNAKKAIANEGALIAENNVELKASTINSGKSSTVAAGIDQQGQLTKQGNIVATANAIAFNGKNSAGKTLLLKAEDNLNLDSSKTYANDLNLTGNDISLRGAKLQSEQKLSVTNTKTINTSDSTILAKQGIALTTNELTSNNSQLISENDITVKANQIKSNASKINTNSAIIIDADKIDLQKTNLSAKGAISLTGSDLNTDNLDLITEQALHIYAKTLSSQHAKLQAKKSIGIKAENYFADFLNLITADAFSVKANQLQLDKSKISALGDITVQGKILHNRESVWLSDNDIKIKADNIENNASQMKAAGSINYQFNDLNNNNTTLISGKRLTFTGDTLHNQQAKWLSGDDIAVDASILFDNQSSLIVSGDALTINTQNMDNGDAELNANKALTIQAKHLLSDNSTLQAGNALTLTTDEQIHASSAKLYAEDKITINSKKIDLAGAFIGAKDDISITGLQQHLKHAELLSTGKVDVTATTIEADDAIIKASNDLTIKVQQSASFNQGQLVTNKKLTFEAPHANTANSIFYAQDGMHMRFTQLHNQNARWFSDDIIHLSARQFNNQKATLQAKQDLDIEAQEINNNEAILLTDGKLAMHAKQIDNRAAQIQTKKGIYIQANNQLQNENAKLITDEHIKINTDNFINTNATLLSHQHIDIHASSFNNEKGLFFADGTINFISKLINNQDSEIKSKQGIDIQTESLVSDRAEYITEGDLNIASKTASMDQVTLSSKGNMVLDNEQTLFMQKAKLIALQNLQIKSNIINSSESNINSLGNINITSAQLTNRNANLISDKDIKINTNTFDNNASEMGARGHIDVNASTLINNHAKWVANDDITIASDELDNTGAQLGGGKSLSINAKKINNQKAIFNTKTDITIQAENLDNTESKLVSGQSITLDSTGLINKGGVVKAGDAITINNQKFDNSDAILVAQAAINIKSNTLNNTNAILQSQSQITVTANQIDNQSALLLSGDKGLRIDSQTLNNQHAKLFTQGELTLHADNIANQNTKLIAEKSLNIQTKQLNNQQAELLAKGDINVQANVLNNQQASLTSEHNIGLNGVDRIDNYRAQLTANGKIELISPNYINNNHAKLLSNTGIKLHTADLSNQSASLKTNGLIQIDADNIDNSHSEFVANNILLESHYLNNTQANLTANNKMVINAWDFNNSQGHLLGDNIYLKTRAFRGDGTIKTTNDLSLDLDESFINDNEITANGHLSIRSAKDIINKNKITAGRQVSLSSQQLVNEQQAEISANYLVLKHQNMTNQGLIDGTTAVLRIDDTLNNLGKGRIYADNLAIGAAQLNNRGQNGLAPVIASRQNFHLGVNRLNNDNHAQLLSLGYFNIGGQLDDNFNVVGNAEVINNHSATIESQGNLIIAANTINNINDHIVTEMRPSDEPPEKETYFQTAEGDGASKYSSNDVLYRIHTKYMQGISGQSCDKHHRCLYKWNDIPEHLRHTKQLQRMSVPSHNINGASDSWEFNVIKQKYRTVVLETDPGKIMAANHLIIQGQTLNNQDSKIVAGQTVSIKVNQLNNTSEETLSKYVYSGNYYLHKRKRKDEYRCKGPYDYTKADEIFIDDALNHNILEHQIFEKKPLNDTPRQLVEVENKNNQQIIDQTVHASISQHGKQIANPIIDLNPNNNLTGDKTNVTVVPNHKQEIITGLPTKPDNNFESIVIDTVEQNKNDTPKDNEPEQPVTEAEMVPSKTISIYEPNLTLPDNSLWIINKETDKNYIVESDPRFTQRKKWLSSDYMLSRLNADPNAIQKRLGDGYYEQQLIREQIIGLTGNRYLHGYRSDLEQYQALMDAGISFANAYGIVPGVELSDEQMRALTTDIVLLVKKTITVGGQTQEVLVPQVYVVNRPQLGTDGALISGENVFVKGDELNSNGLIKAKNDILLDGHNVTNKGTIYGGRVSINAENDITNYGKLVGDKLVYLSADNDINLLSSTRTQTRGRNLTTNIDQTSIIQVNDGNVVIDAGHDINTKAGWIINNGESGNTWLQAGNDIKFNTADIEEKLDFRVKKDYRKTDEKSVVGTGISAANNVMLIAGNDINAKTVDITAGNHLGLQADNDIILGSSAEHFELDEFHKSKSKGFLNKTTTTTHTEIDNTTQKGSELYGDSVSISAGNNLKVTGSQVIGSNDVVLNAGKEVTIDAAEESYYRKQETKTKKSGLMSSGGIGFTVGKEKESLKQTNTEQAFLGSVVGSTDGSVNIRAGKDVNIKGSEVIAQRDIKLQGENVNIEALDAKTTYKEEYKHQKSGLTVAVTGTVSDMYNANQTREQAKKQTNEKTKALMNIKAGLQAGNAALETGANLQNGVPEASIGINLSLGSEKTKRTVNQEQHTVVSSGISAGHNVSIIATGNGQKESGDINIIGSQVSAGHDAMLKANHDVNIVGQENTSKTDTKEKSSSGSVGVGYNFGGQKNGFNISANASHSKSREKGNGTDWTESVVEAGNKLTIITGNDANIIAGQVKGDSVVADIGHDLNIESKQDSDEFHSKSTSASAGGSISMGGGGSANASASKTKMDSNWQSVTDQSGIFAGKGGFDIKVGNNTDLKGAVISSEAKDTSKNRLDTGTISFSDIENKADYKVSSSSAGISSSGMPSMPTSRNKSEKANSTTQSAVSEGTIIIRNKDGQQQDIDDLSRDTEQANNELKHIFNKEKEQDIIDQTHLVSEIGGETLTMLNHIDRISAESAANKKLKEEQKKAKEQGLVLTDEQEQKIYEKAYNDAMNEGMSAMGSDTRQGVEMAVNIINGLITGDMTGAVAGALAPKIATIIKQQTEGNTVANTISHAILGAVVAELQGNSALAGGLGAAASERSAEVIAGILYPDKAVTELSQEERQKISALSQLATGLAIAASGGDIQDVNTGIAASKNAVENNFAAVVVRAGGMICVRISVCANYVAGTGLAALLGISVVNSLSENDKTNAINAIRSGDSFAIASLTEEQIDFLNKNKNDFLIADFADRIPLIHGQESNSSTSQNNGVDGSSDSNNIAGSGSVVAGGAPGLPPDDDGDNDKRQNENSQKYQKQKQQERFDELKDIYDKNNPTTDLKIDGQTIRQGANGNRYSTRIYESQNLTDKQIYNYAEELAGQPLTKVRDGIYTARLQDGTNITLRNVSSSNTGARWTIDIRNSPTLTNLYRGLRTGAEIKFR
ncbi:hemagglutinin repeat-containing protein, partial [Gilliamella sp. Fer4-1]|uniref:hemagglutinin repeat-containing protein n=2 Tax=Gilliamella sp. Fer4-1 TaxID=3120242 RepID=UPI00080EBAD0